MRVDVAGRLTKALVSPQLSEAGVFLMKEEASKLHDLVGASKPCRFSIDD
jgi:hypothetical protein